MMAVAKDGLLLATFCELSEHFCFYFCEPALIRKIRKRNLRLYVRIQYHTIQQVPANLFPSVGKAAEN